MLAEKLASKEGLATIYGSLGFLALARGCWPEAREWVEKELSLAREIGRQELIAFAQYHLALSYVDEGRPDLALPLAQKALAIDKRLNHRRLPWTQELVERLTKETSKQ